MNISDIWMISSYGGGSTIQPSDYYRAKPKHIIASQVYPSGTNPPPAAEAKPPSGTVSVQPPWKRYAARARWLVYHSVWSAVSTVSVRLHGAPWGNVRSTADGVGRNSTGLPFLYIPTPDPSAIDVQHDANVTLSFTEAALGPSSSAEQVGTTRVSACACLALLIPYIDRPIPGRCGK